MNPWIPHLLRAGGGGGGAVLPPTGRTMLANLTSSLILDEGTGGPTWSRATKAWGFNELGYLEELASGCAFFGGARLVRNACPSSEDFSVAAWTKNNLTVTGTNIVVSSAATILQRLYPSSSMTMTAGQRQVVHARLEYINHPFVQIHLHATFSTEYVNFDLVNGTFQVSGGTASAAMTLVSPGVYDCYVYITCASSATTSSPLIIFATSLASAQNAVFAGDGVKSFKLLRVMSCDVTNYNASYVPEYVSVGSDTDKNFLLHTDDFSQAAWTKTNITHTQSAIANPVNGLINAQKVEATADAATNMYQSVTNCGSTAGNIASFYVKQGSGATDANRFLVRNVTTATNLLSINVNYSTGVIAYVVGSSGASVTDVGNGWWLVKLVVTSGISNNDTLSGYIAFVGSPETAGEFCYIYRPYLGRGTTAPAVLPAVAGVWDPFGAGIDGAKYFETDWQGAPIAAANLLGFRREVSAINNLLHSRDLSNAAWSTKTNITAAKTATGLDGIANTSTTLTATAADAIILQPISLASAARCASAYVKRRTGTGTISFTQDGGSTWTDITSQINSSTWSRVEITATLANPSVGFKISTSGDAIDVDCVQNEAGAVATSPIVTTTAAITRNADSDTYQTASNWSDTAGTAYIEAQPWQWSSGGLLGSATNGLLGSASNSGATAYDGTNTANGPTGTPSGRKKLALRWTGSTMDVSVGGVIGTAGTYDGAMGLASLGIAVNSSGYFGPSAVWNYAMTDDEFKALTT